MKKSVALVLFCCLVLTKLKRATALECYVCPACGDPFDAKKEGILKVTCEGSCMKAKADSIVGRSCSSMKMETKCDEQEKDGHSGALCYCNTDLCNGSSSLKVTMATGITFMFAILRKTL